MLYTVLRSRSSWDLLGEALAVTFGFDRAPALGDPTVGGVVRGAATLQWVVVAGAGLAVLAFARRRGAVVALVVVAADLAWAGVGYNPAIDRALAIQPTTPRDPRLQRAARRGSSRPGTSPRTRSRWTTTSPRRAATTCRSRSASTGSGATKLSPEFPSQVGPLPAFIPLVLPKVDEDRLTYLRCSASAGSCSR